MPRNRLLLVWYPLKRFLVISVVAGFCGCLENPTLDGGSGTTAGADYCGECSIGESRCGESDGREVFQTCEARFDGGSDRCYVWVDSAVCDAVQSCKVGVGCECPEGCEPEDVTGEFDCTTDPPTLCVMAGACAIRVAACRSDDCAAIEDQEFCGQFGDHPQCNACAGAGELDDGRSCQPVCGSATCFTCGAPPIE